MEILPCVALFILCVSQYTICLILMEHRNLKIEEQRFILNQTYFEPSKDFKS
jgi:hypothetical protein